MNVAVIASYDGKKKYQSEYNRIINSVESEGGNVLSAEKSQQYLEALSREAPLRNTTRAHYEFIRKSILDSDAVIVEASWEDFRIGHEATLALLYRKPVLALSQSIDLGEYIHHPDFYGAKYKPDELDYLIKSFLKKVKRQNKITSEKPLNIRANTSKTIAVFGAVCADIFNKVASIPKEDEVALSGDFKISLGGKATNAAVALARMGNDVFICGNVGHDSMGSDIEAALIHEGIRTDFLERDRLNATGTVTLTVDDFAKYSTVVHEAANIHITKEAVDDVFAKVDKGKLHLDCIYLTLEPQEDMVSYIVQEASKRDLFIFCDAAPYTRPLNSELLPLIDIVAPNQLETKAMTGILVKDENTAKQSAKALADYGAKKVIITMGDTGSFFYDTKERPRYTAAIKVDAVDEAAAGDAFRAVFLNELLQGSNTEDALKRATIAGAYAVTHFGGYDSMPFGVQLDSFLSEKRRASTGSNKTFGV